MCSIRFFVCFSLTVANVLCGKVLTTSYGKLHGRSEYSDDGNHKHVFKGIPFAKPPIGNLRFALPQAPNPWNGIRDALDYSTACMSNSTVTKSPQDYISEDCLYINIFTSEECLSKKCPVIIYYHGGGFSSGAATMFSEEFILKRYVAEGIVFVIPAYRLGVFGQLYFGQNNILSENLLMFDNVMSLNYVHEEIDNFGGDTSQVTIMGHSAGGTIVDVLGFSKTIDPEMERFQKIIAFSPPGMFGVPQLVIDNSFEMARRLGCYKGTRDDQIRANIAEIMSCLREVDGREILRVQREMEEFNGLNFRAIIRGAPFMPLDGKISDLKKNTVPRKMISGVTQFEFTSIRLVNPFISGGFLDFDNPYQVADHFDTLYASHIDDWVIGDSAAIFISAGSYSEALVKSGGTAYLFETRQKPFSDHVSDMQYFIGLHREPFRNKDIKIVDSFYSKMLVNFTKYDVPSPEWDELDPAKMNYLALEVDTKLRIQPRMMNDYHRKERDIWLVDMVNFDKKITAELHANHDDSSEYDDETSIQIRIAPSIFSQWWFYLGIFATFFVIVVVFGSVRKVSTDERQPLLAA